MEESLNRNTIVTYTAGGRSVLFSCQYASPIWITDMTGVSSNNVQISEVQGAAQIGNTISNQSVQPKDITINGAVLKEAEINRSAILACVLPGVTGRLTVTQGGKSWYIDGAPKSTPEFSNGSAAQTFQFSLHCPYPYFTSSEDGSSVVAGLTKLFQFPCGLAGEWYVSKSSESLVSMVENTGASPIEFDVVFSAKAPVTNPEIYHVERGSYIRINKEMAAGETITVSTVYGHKGVVVRLPDSTQTNGFKYLDVGSDLNLQMDPGSNTIRGDAENGKSALSIKIVMPKGVVPGL